MRGQRAPSRMSSRPSPLTDPKTKQPVSWARDEHMRPDSTRRGSREAGAGVPEGWRRDGRQCFRLWPTAAAALVVADAALARERGLKPLGRLVAYAVAGVEPSLMGIGPAPGRARGARAGGLTLAQMDLWK